jgi:hypothetical protein
VGKSAHYVAVRADRDPQPVRRFECFTADLYRLADWLQSCGVKTVALQGKTGFVSSALWQLPEPRATMTVVHRVTAAELLQCARSFVGIQQTRYRRRAIGTPAHSCPQRYMSCKMR